MARPEVNIEKHRQVSALMEGDKIQLTTGEKVVFVRIKQKDFLGIMEDGKRYSIFMNKFDKVLEQVSITNIIQSESKTNDKEIQVRQLNIGDKVKLTDGSIAEFVKVNQKRFVGTIKGKEYTIPFSMFVSIIEKSNGAVKDNNKAGFILKSKKKDYETGCYEYFKEIFETHSGEKMVAIEKSESKATRFDSIEEIKAILTANSMQNELEYFNIVVIA
jgi:hypothetical protein